VYTPTRTLTLYAPDLEAQRAWVAALRAAGEQVYDAEELKAKATALQEMAPLLLDQAQRQFKRMHQILASLKCTGYVVQDERVKSLKKVRDSASFLGFSELQHCVDGVFMIIRESTRLVTRSSDAGLPRVPARRVRGRAVLRQAARGFYFIRAALRQGLLRVAERPDVGLWFVREGG